MALLILSMSFQENWEHIALTMEGPWVMGLEGWHQIGTSHLPRGPKMLRGLFQFFLAITDDDILGFFSLNEEDDCQDSFFDLGCESCRCDGHSNSNSLSFESS